MQPRELVIVADFVEECVIGNCLVRLLHLLRSYHLYGGEKLVRERGAGSGDWGVGISSPNFLKF
jgi:hypothetical protein